LVPIEQAAQLLLKINEGLPEETQARYNSLLKNSVQSTLSEEGRTELLQLIPKVEKQYTERLSYLIQLASLWNCSVYRQGCFLISSTQAHLERDH